VIDTHAFAFSPIFLRENALPEGLDGTFDTLAQDMERAGVAKTIATVSVTRQDDFFESVARGLDRHPTRIAAQLHLAPNQPDWTAANLQAAVGDPRIAGARAALSLFKMHPVDERLEKVWDVCERGRLPVQLVVDASKYADPESVAILARQHPGLTVLLSLTRARHRAGLPPLSRYGSVYFQLPGLLDGEIAKGEPALLGWAARHLPAERLVFGSDRLGREPSYFAKVSVLRGLGPALFDRMARANPLEIYGHRLPAWRELTSKP
jgi:predicted TIM-barrel fold metal-dependent hydrolase